MNRNISDNKSLSAFCFNIANKFYYNEMGLGIPGTN